MASQGFPAGDIGAELRKMLAPNEPVLAYATGKGASTLIATDRRVIIIKIGVAATGSWGGRQSNSFGYGQITGVEVRKQMFDGYVEISAGGVQNVKRSRVGQLQSDNTVPYNKRYEAAFEHVVNVIRRHLYAPPAPTQPASAPPQDIPSQIAALAQLRDQGVLSSAEFEAKKAELLARM